ncbi:MAG: alpha/beta fold hydrolase [Synergistales bacterium]|nr:alpha/beta fold hydrolase [Synergistales bacterium]
MLYFIIPLGLVIFAVLIWVVRNLERLIFYPDRILHDPGEIAEFSMEDVFFPGDRGMLHGWYVEPVEKTTSFVLLVCHGNRGNLSTPFRIALIKTLPRLGADIFVFDYSGMGKSEGRISEIQARMDAAHAWEYLTGEKGISPGRIIIFGRSLGGPVAAWLASRRTPVLLVLEATFPSMASEIKTLCPFLPEMLIHMVVKDSFQTACYLKDITFPVLFVHGTRDRLVPTEEGKKVYASCGSPRKVFMEISQGGHKAFQWERDAYLDAVEEGMAALGFSLQGSR